MTFKEKLARMEALFAYDMGATDSGIKDDLFKDSLCDAIGDEVEKLLTELAKQYLNSDDGYTIEDVKRLIDWAEEQLEFYL